MVDQACHTENGTALIPYHVEVMWIQIEGENNSLFKFVSIFYRVTIDNITFFTGLDTFFYLNPHNLNKSKIKKWNLSLVVSGLILAQT